MGDRGNIKITDSFKNKVFLYTHWSGSKLPEIVKHGLALPQARARWTDGAYLARILFCHLVKGQEDGETGFGISSVIGDGDGQVMHVDCTKQTVRWNKGKAIPFTEYVADVADVAAWYGKQKAKAKLITHAPPVLPYGPDSVEVRLTAIEALLQVNRDARPVDVGAIGYLRRAGL